MHLLILVICALGSFHGVYGVEESSLTAALLRFARNDRLPFRVFLHRCIGSVGRDPFYFMKNSGKCERLAMDERYVQNMKVALGEPLYEEVLSHLFTFSNNVVGIDIIPFGNDTISLELRVDDANGVSSLQKSVDSTPEDRLLIVLHRLPYGRSFNHIRW